MALLRKQLSSNFKSSRTTNIHYHRHSNIPPGSITDFVWKDYCTSIFRNIQELGDINYEDYMMSICNHETLKELSLRGGSGKPLCVRHDDRFIMKVVRKSEAKVLIDMLPNYYAHLKKHRNSLLVKYYGLHASRPGTGGPKVYFVVVENLLITEQQIHRQYDLKGSSQGRTPNKTGTQTRLTLKDLDFDLCFFLDPSTQRQLLEQIKIDCKFLEDHGIMDYSLLLGVHIVPPTRASKDEKKVQESCKTEQIKEPAREEAQNGSDPPYTKESEPRHRRDPTLSDFFTDYNRPGARFGGQLPARATKMSYGVKEGSTASSRKPRIPEKPNVYLYLGIIDFLQNYNMIKKLEHAYKSLQYDAREISSVNPKHYAGRFQEFLWRVFLSDDFRLDSPSSESQRSSLS